MDRGYSAGTAIQGLLQLKDLLKKDHVVVVILHDHGSRYVGKIYNDQWMMERGFLDVKTFKDIIAGRGTKRIITAGPDQSVSEAFELVEDGLLNEADFRSFMFGNSVRLHATMNPHFFKGTAVETEATREMSGPA